MRYLFVVIVCVFLFSCAGGEEYDLQIQNPVLGVWNNYYEDTDSLVMTRVFTLNFYSYFSFAEGKPQNLYNKQKYIIEGDQIMLQKYTQTYKIAGDTLWITNSLGDKTIKYVKNRWSLPGAVE